MNKRLMDFARKTLKSDLAKCTEEQQAKFLTTFTYITTPKPQNVNEAVDRMPDEELEHIMDVVEQLVKIAKIKRMDQIVKDFLESPRDFYYMSASGFNLLVQTFYDYKDYEFSANEEIRLKIYKGIGAKLDGYDLKDLAKFKTGVNIDPLMARILLNDLCDNNIIPPGDYIIQDES